MAEDQIINRWWRVAGGLSMNLALGSVHAWSIFSAPLVKEFGSKPSDISMAFTILASVFGLSLLAGALLQDKKGPFVASVIGGVLVSLGFFACGYANSLNAFLFWFGVVVGIGSGFGYATPIPVAAKWFPDRRGLAVGLVVTAYGAGSAIFGPLGGNWLIPVYGWRTTFMILGAIFFIMTMVGAFLLQNPPVAWKPEGWTPPSATARTAATTHEFTPTEVLRTPTFYLMWIAYALSTSAGFMVISRLLPFARSQGIPTALAARAIFIGAVGNASGRIFSGWLSDHLGRLNTLRLMIAISAVAMPILFHVGANMAMLYVLVFVVYYCYSTMLSVNAAATADFWGTRNMAVNYYLLSTAVVGERFIGRIGLAVGGMMFAFYTAGLLAVIALGCVLLARRPGPPPNHREGA